MIEQHNTYYNFINATSVWKPFFWKAKGIEMCCRSPGQGTGLWNSKKLYSLYVEGYKWYIFNGEQLWSWFVIHSLISIKYSTKFLGRALQQIQNNFKPNQAFPSKAIRKLEKDSCKHLKQHTEIRFQIKFLALKMSH